MFNKVARMQETKSLSSSPLDPPLPTSYNTEKAINILAI